MPVLQVLKVSGLRWHRAFVSKFTRSDKTCLALGASSQVDSSTTPLLAALMTTVCMVAALKSHDCACSAAVAALTHASVVFAVAFAALAWHYPHLWIVIDVQWIDLGKTCYESLDSKRRANMTFLTSKRLSKLQRPLLLLTAASVFALAGCANMTESQRGTATGVGVGTAAGAVIGAIAGDGKGAAIGATLGGLGGYVWSQRMERQKTDMENAMASSGVVVTQTQDNRLKLDIPSDISFDTGRSDIKPQFAPLLDQFANSLRNNPNTDVVIVGHTDNTGTDAINNPLSVNRAASTRQYLSSRGVNVSRIQIDGRGSYQPVASNATADGRARNRRVEIFVGEPSQAR